MARNVGDGRLLELRYAAETGSLEYRYRPLRIDAWGALRGLDSWTDWQPVVTVVTEGSLREQSDSAILDEVAARR